MSKGNPQHAAVPRLRFPEFRDAGGWSQAPLGAALTERGQKSDGVSEVHSVSLSKGIVPQVEHMGRSFAASDTSHYNLVRPFDIVYTRSPLAIFKLGIVKQHKGENNAIVSPLYGVFEPRNQHLGLIVEAFFESPARSVRYLDPLAQKGAKNTIQLSNERFLSGSLCLPDDEDEQRKVAECLGSLDDLIAAEGRKLAALRDHKQGLMQQLFPRPGETQPRLRFPEFQDAGAWEPTVIDELANIQSGGTPSKSNPDYWGGTIPWVSAKDMKTVRLSDTEDHVTDDAVEDGAKEVPAGTVLMLTRGMTLLKDVPICLLQRSMTYNQDVKALRPRKGVVSEFLAYLLLASKPSLRALVGIAGHGTGRLNTDEVKGLELSKPTPAEQHRIADCLSALDARIAGQAAKLDALRTHKRGLMQQLFPSPEDCA